MSVQFGYEHLTPFEPAARIFCDLSDQDPDEQLEVPHPMGLAVPFARPAWHFAAENLINLSRMMVAMQRAAAQAKVINGEKH